MSTGTTQDGTEIYFKGSGRGQPILFRHGWPLTVDAFEDQMFFSHGGGIDASPQPGAVMADQAKTWDGNKLDTYADDLAKQVIELDLKGIHVGHSTGGGEVARYIGRYGTGRVAIAADQCHSVDNVEERYESLGLAARAVRSFARQRCR